MKNKEILDAYTPLKRVIRSTSLEDSLFVIWAYSRNLQTGKPMPPGINLHPMFLSENVMEKGIYQWSLESIAKEVLINSERIPYLPTVHQTFRNPSVFGKVVNQLNKIDNEIANEFLSPENILIEFSRIAFRLFPWQRDFVDNSYLMRYYKIFKHIEISEIITETIGLTVDEIYLFCIFFNQQFLTNPAVLPSVGNDNFSIKHRKFIDYFSKDIDELRNILIAEHIIDEQYLYAGAQLRLHPLIKMVCRSQECIFCPLPTLFFWRVTSGLYYDIVGHKRFNQAFGKAFEKYIGMVLSKNFENTAFNVIPESKYIVHKSDEDSVDWILDDFRAALFIECKSKRMTLNSKINLSDTEALFKDISALAKYIVKLYKTIDDYEKNHYTNLKCQIGKNIYPLFLTLENWYIFHEQYRDKLIQLITQGLIKANISPDVLQRMPYTLCSIGEFEQMIQIIKETGIYDFFEPKVRDKEKNSYEIGTYCGEKFKDINIEFLFIDEYESLLQTTKLLLGDWMALDGGSL